MKYFARWKTLPSIIIPVLNLDIMRASLGFWESLWGVSAILVYGVAGLPVVLLGLAAGKIPVLPLKIMALACLIPVGVFLFIFFVIIISGAIHALIPWPKEGEYPLTRSGAVLHWTLHAGIVNYLRVPGFLKIVHANPLLRRVYYGLSGGSVHPSAIISYDSVLLDPFMLTIGANAKIGEFTKLAGHYADPRRFVIGRIIIEPGAIIGAESTIGANVRIGRNSLLGARSLVLPGTIVGEGETWAGNPARRRRQTEEAAPKKMEKSNEPNS